MGKTLPPDETEKAEKTDEMRADLLQRKNLFPVTHSHKFFFIYTMSDSSSANKAQDMVLSLLLKQVNAVVEIATATKRLMMNELRVDNESDPSGPEDKWQLEI